MNYYTTPKIGTGAHDNPFRPDIPEGTSFVGNIGSDGEYLIITPVELSSKTGRVKHLPWQAVENADKAKGIPFTDVRDKWFISS